jgi:hypothetical protein
MESKLLPLLAEKSKKTFRKYLKILDCMEKVEECNPDMQIMVMTLNSSNF